MKLVGETYWWWKDNHCSRRCWFVLQDLLRTQYAPHFLFTELRETLEGIRKIIEGMVTKVDIDSEPSILAEPEVIDKSEPEVEVDESEAEVVT